MSTSQATFAAGCFWGVESRFRALDGVLDTEVGYTGGSTDHPDYAGVCTGNTGHAEAVRVVYDPDRITYHDLLDAFFAMHDPTQENGQGVDIGSQYRSAIFVHDAEQLNIAVAARQTLQRSGRFGRPIATEIVEAGRFWRAEEYHQRYLEKNGRQCGLR